jgi:hypothetical protein
MTDIHIPPEAVEAAARAAYYAFTEINIGDGEDRWERLLPRFRAEYREQARAALLAGLRAWPGMWNEQENGSKVLFDGTPNLILPMQKNPDSADDKRSAIRAAIRDLERQGWKHPQEKPDAEA